MRKYTDYNMKLFNKYIINILININNIYFKFISILNFIKCLWGLGIGDWGLAPIPNPQSPIPNPQSPIPNLFVHIIIKIYYI